MPATIPSASKITESGFHWIGDELGLEHPVIIFSSNNIPTAS